MHARTFPARCTSKLMASIACARRRHYVRTHSSTWRHRQTPNYMLYEDTIKAIAALPNVKLLIFLRDPVSRTFRSAAPRACIAPMTMTTPMHADADLRADVMETCCPRARRSSSVRVASHARTCARHAKRTVRARARLSAVETPPLCCVCERPCTCAAQLLSVTVHNGRS